MKELMFSFSRSASENAVRLTGTVSAVSSFLRAVTLISSRFALKIIVGSAGEAVSACRSPGTSAYTVHATSARTEKIGGRFVKERSMIGKRDASKRGECL